MRRTAILLAVVGPMLVPFAGAALAVVKVGNGGPNGAGGTERNPTRRRGGGTCPAAGA